MSSLPAVVATALASALAAAASSVLQHRSARRAPDSTGRNGLTLLRHLAGQPLWLLGSVSAAVGLALHVAALGGGRLAFVQPLLVSGLLFALPVSVLLERRRPSLVQWVWAAVVMIGLSTFLLVARPHGGSGATHAPRLLLVTIAGGASMAVLAVGARGDGRWRPVLLASAGGIGFGVTSALMKECTAAAGHGPASVLASWALYGVLLVGAAAITLTQVAYRSGPLASSLPAMTIGDPAAAVLIGVLAFHEQVNNAPVAVASQVVAFGLMGVGTWQLARLTASSDQ
jgi:drug/metabolite transporter (DMT)-like permease